MNFIGKKPRKESTMEKKSETAIAIDPDKTSASVATLAKCGCGTGRQTERDYS